MPINLWSPFPTVFTEIVVSSLSRMYYSSVGPRTRSVNLPSIRELGLGELSNLEQFVACSLSLLSQIVFCVPSHLLVLEFMGYFHPCVQLALCLPPPLTTQSAISMPSDICSRSLIEWIITSSLRVCLCFTTAMESNPIRLYPIHRRGPSHKMIVRSASGVPITGLH